MPMGGDHVMAYRGQSQLPSTTDAVIADSTHVAIYLTQVFEMHKVPYPESYGFPEYSKASSAQVAAAKALEPAARKVEFSDREACDEFRCALCQFPGGDTAWTSKATVLGHIQDR